MCVFDYMVERVNIGVNPWAFYLKLPRERYGRILKCQTPHGAAGWVTRLGKVYGTIND